MRLLFVADGRSPTALNWMRYWVERGDEVFLTSTFACKPKLSLAGLDFVPVAFSRAKRGAPGSNGASSRTLGLRTVIRQWFGPLTIPRAARQLRAVIERVQPDLIHAMRIPYEGMLAADAYSANIPLVVSVWGNDFTLHGPSTPLMRHYTRWALHAADGLHTDCQRDARLAKQWEYSVNKPTLVVPGNGGIRADIFYPPSQPAAEPIVINPRGLRAYVRNDVFFKAIPLVLQKIPQARFICSSLAGDAQALKWIHELKIEQAVELKPSLPHEQMADEFRRAQVIVSPSVHDGTPNSLLEGMACGCFPVAGNLESIREWITPGQNGWLTDAADPRALADSILNALENKDLREKAAGLNTKLIAVRAEYRACMKQAESFYKKVLTR